MKTGIVLIHGLAGTPGELRYLQNALLRSGFDVAVPVIPGLACGTDFSRMSRWQDWRTKALSEYDRLAATCDQVVIGGLSAGAILSLTVAIERPGCAGLLLMSPTLKVDGWSIPWTFKLFTLVQQKMVARLFNFSERQPYGIKDERIRAMAIQALKAEMGMNSQQIFSVNGSMFLELRRMRRYVVGKLHDIKTPALIAHPRHDDQSDLANAFHLQRGLNGPTMSIVLDDSYHVVTLDRQRGDVVGAVNRFLECHVTKSRPQVADADTGEPREAAQIENIRHV